ncbi:arylsulfotransferase ASST [Albidovulum inexpectatum]|uniref:Arylsulfotransferase ASST n=1 Tax=Albidovulum inexpectatum TaxID=196587 RepID=A0A2S5JL17_9RHOB|nr:arylsulfotransferase family protein [Albidovulum inexpectatum]PPB82179.1 arylsulfotransferase ASST [Albidovulum inexpectatum]
MSEEKTGRRARLAALAGAGVLLFGLGLFAGVKSIPPAPQLRQTLATMGQLKVLVTAALFKRPDQHLGPRLHEGEGVTIARPDIMAPGVTFISGLFGQRLGFRLFGRDGQILYDWPVDFFQIAPDEMEHRYHALIHGAVLMENGDVVANLDGRGMVRLDACGKIIWRNHSRSHHAIFRDHRGWLWAPLGVAEHRAPDIAGIPFRMDRLGAFNPETGDQIAEIDLLDVLQRSDMIGLIQDIYRSPEDVLHLNDVEVLPPDLAAKFPMFDSGDILVSLRNLNQLWVIDGTEHRIKWIGAGATIGQHDPDFEPDGTISVLDNRPRTPIRAPDGYPGPHGGSRILLLDPERGGHAVLYQGDDRNPFYTPYRGKHQVLENGNVLIAETDAGRAFEVTPGGDITWEYLNIWDATNSGWVLDITRYPTSHGDFVQGLDCAAK